jgi:integrase
VNSSPLALEPLLLVTPRYPSEARRAVTTTKVQIETVDDVLSLWLERCDEAQLEGARPLTEAARKGYGYSCESLSREFGRFKAADLKARDVKLGLARIAAGRLDERGRKRGGKSAAWRDRNTLAAAFKYAIALEVLPIRVLPTQPAEIVRIEAPNRRRDTHVPIETARAITAVALEYGISGRISVSASRAIRLGILTGLRIRSDLLRLRVEHVDAAAMVLRMHIAKADEWMTIPISVEALALLDVAGQHAVDGWLFPGRRSRGKLTHIANVYRAWALVLDRVAELGHNIKDRRGRRIVPHMCRHIFASAGLGAGKSATNVSRVIGQKSSASAFLYESAGIAGMRDTVDAFAEQLKGTNAVPIIEGTFGSRLKARMVEQGYNQAQLAAVLKELGYQVTAGSVGNWTRDVSLPGLDKVHFICEALECTADYLAGVSRG